MKKSLTLALALITLAVFSGFGLAHPQGERTVQLSLPCCKCLGESHTLDLSTGHAPWNVTLLPSGSTVSAFSTPPVSSWCTTLSSDATWIQPVASPTPSPDVPKGVYKYTLSFYISKCTIPSVVKLDGKFAADNSVLKVLLQPGNIQITTPTCSGTCFKAPQCPVNLVVPPPLLVAGSHALEIYVTNEDDRSYSGLIVKARLARQCVTQ